jgi:hypothetical protein
MTRDPRDRTEGTDSGGTHTYDQPATQAERRKMLVNERRVRDGWQGGPPEPTTYFAQAGLDDDDLGGRYAPRKGPDPVPQQPPHSPWACDPVGIEPPLNERVDALPDMITVDGYNARGLPDWQYGPAPTEQHSAYLPDTDESVGPNTEGSFLTSVAAEGSPQTISAVAEPSAVPIKETEPRHSGTGGLRRF